jgi:uncharacterized protein YjiS (DUF1127 family)
MSVLHLAHARSPIRGRVRGASNDWVHRTAVTIREWRRRRRGRDQLLALNEEMLKDIGITRAEALFLGNKPFWKE